MIAFTSFSKCWLSLMEKWKCLGGIYQKVFLVIRTLRRIKRLTELSSNENKILRFIHECLQAEIWTQQAVGSLAMSQHMLL